MKTGTTVTANQTTAPDGTTNADLITTSATPATISTASTQSGNYASSVFAKKGTSDWIYMLGQVTDNAKAWFNLATGAVGTVEAGLVKAYTQEIGNGWWRCTIIDVGGTGAEPVGVGICDANGSTTTTVGRTVYLWGAQGESNSGDFASSYCPFARAADVAVMTGSNFSSWYNQPAGTFVAEYYPFSTAGTRMVISADNNATSEVLRHFIDAGAARIQVLDNSVGQFTPTLASGIAALTVHKLGLSFAAADFAGCWNGGTVTAAASGTLPTPTQLRLGASASATEYLNGHVRRIRFYNTAKSDAELQALTT